MKTRKLMAMAMAGAMALPTCTAFADSAEEPVKLTGLFISHSLTKSVNDMQWLQEIEEKAGVEVEWEQIDTESGMRQKFYEICIWRYSGYSDQCNS